MVMRMQLEPVPNSGFGEQVLGSGRVALQLAERSPSRTVTRRAARSTSSDQR